MRVEVDETEVGRVSVGQKAYVTADAFPGQKFWGQVIRAGEQLGRKNIRTDEPAERVDTKVLEALIELYPGVQLPIGLRVDSFILSDQTDTALSTYGSLSWAARPMTFCNLIDCLLLLICPQAIGPMFQQTTQLARSSQKRTNTY